MRAYIASSFGFHELRSGKTEELGVALPLIEEYLELSKCYSLNGPRSRSVDDASGCYGEKSCLSRRRSECREWVDCYPMRVDQRRTTQPVQCRTAFGQLQPFDSKTEIVDTH
jgi:hypothetical protein